MSNLITITLEAQTKYVTEKGHTRFSNKLTHSKTKTFNNPLIEDYTVKETYYMVGNKPTPELLGKSFEMDLGQFNVVIEDFTFTDENGEEITIQLKKLRTK